MKERWCDDITKNKKATEEKIKRKKIITECKDTIVERH